MSNEWKKGPEIENEGGEGREKERRGRQKIRKPLSVSWEKVKRKRGRREGERKTEGWRGKLREENIEERKERMEGGEQGRKGEEG